MKLFCEFVHFPWDQKWQDYKVEEDFFFVREQYTRVPLLYLEVEELYEKGGRYRFDMCIERVRSRMSVYAYIVQYKRNRETRCLLWVKNRSSDSKKVVFQICHEKKLFYSIQFKEKTFYSAFFE